MENLNNFLSKLTETKNIYINLTVLIVLTFIFVTLILVVLNINPDTISINL